MNIYFLVANPRLALGYNFLMLTKAMPCVHKIQNVLSYPTRDTFGVIFYVVTAYDCPPHRLFCLLAI